MATLRKVLNDFEESLLSYDFFAIRPHGTKDDWYFPAFMEMLEEENQNFEIEAWMSAYENRVFTNASTECLFEIIEGEWFDVRGGREFKAIEMYVE